MIRHLIYHIWPASHTKVWQWNLDQLKQRLHVFNGRKIIGVAVDRSSESAQTIMKYLDGYGCEFITTKNISDKGELVTFETMLSMVNTVDPDVAVFYGHAKGVKYDPTDLRNKTIRQWTELMYEHNLRDIPRVEALLQDKAFAGCFRRHPTANTNAYYFSGTFFWFRACKVFDRSHKMTVRERWGVEYWPSTFTKFSDTACLFGDDAGRLYVQSQLDAAIARGTDEVALPVEAKPDNFFAQPRRRPLPPRRPQPVAAISKPVVAYKLQHPSTRVPDVDTLKTLAQVALSSKKHDATSFDSGVTLITPTGDRHTAFALCEKWMAKQSYNGPLQWIVVDDGKIPTVCTANQQYIRREAKLDSEGHTLTKNLRTALPHIAHDKILIIEDDEWYSADYVTRMANWLRAYPLVGAGYARYYWPSMARYREFPEHRHSSLCRTGFTAAMLPAFAAAIAPDNPSVDMRVWAAYGVVGHRYPCPTPLVVGMKQLAGRASGGGDAMSGKPDFNLAVLRSWIGDDVAQYQQMLPKMWNHNRAKTEKIVVYTVNLGDYDKFLQPLNPNPDVTYIAITDGVAPKPWQTVAPPQLDMDVKYQTRWLKSLSHCLFPDADWTIYYDSQLQLTVDPVQLIAECEAWGDATLYAFRHQDRNCLYDEAIAVKRIGKDRSPRVDAQIARYGAMPFPRNAGLYLGGMLIRRNDPRTSKFNETWWCEISSGSHRDQISFPVALRESGVPFVALPAMWWTHFFNRQYHNRNNFGRNGAGFKQAGMRPVRRQ